LTYINFTSTQVLKELLPPGLEVPTGFELVGDIAHMNLSQDQMPYRFIIGQTILDKNKNLRSVVAKIGKIESKFRFYECECIAGDPSEMLATVVEDKIRFRVDITQVYWCSKLGTERSRLIERFFKPGEVLCDMFCGVGPLAIKAVKRVRDFKAIVNDLNPAAIKFVEKNLILNKIGGSVRVYNMDAREFIKEIVGAGAYFDHCHMNLPVDAIEFLDVFRGLFKQNKTWAKLPLIHVYGFIKTDEEDPIQIFIQRISIAMAYKNFSQSDV
jgi:tRNA (guanine37-N1)-methyltransferase